jgi:Niemann-Pick C1 protein
MQLSQMTHPDGRSFVLFQAVGIAVEFCSHIIRAFILSTEKTRVQRATDVLINTGSSVSLKVLQVASGSTVCCDL